METIKKLLDKLELDWVNLKNEYEYDVQSNNDIRSTEVVFGDGFEIAIVTFFDDTNEWNLIMDEYGALEDTTPQRIVNELINYFG